MMVIKKSATSFLIGPLHTFFIGPVHVQIIFTEIGQTLLSFCYVFAFPHSEKETLFRHLPHRAGERGAYRDHAHTFIVPSTKDLGSVPMN